MSDISVLNVGQGDCTVVFDSSSRAAVLIDCPQGKAGVAVAHLVARSAERLAAVMVSHLHSDHYGGILDFLRTCPLAPERFIVSPALWLADRHPSARSFLQGVTDELPAGMQRELALRSTKPVTLGEAQVQWYCASDETFLQVLAGKNTNLVAVATLATVGDRRALLCSDAPAERWLELDTLDGLPSADVLVAPHHGGRFDASGFTLERLLDRVSPGLVLLSVGSRNGYKHPHTSVLETVRGWVANNAAELRCTQVNEACRVAASTTGGGAPDMPCAGTITINAEGALYEIERQNFDTAVLGYADPHCQ